MHSLLEIFNTKPLFFIDFVKYAVQTFIGPFIKCKMS